ncbi:P1 family peptidase [Anaerosphaera multitolerans]|uniref:Peptidase S58 family protein n=1 Tax=Anaerosphaera multitolerans TaxID=2487351 RepID=A0A437S605_9FIRM|nr:P1 family peptidase [Anaerosphaera multitolerans]RVU54451.1 peptidase S58 family protein [Anaerosphaera multitolerans]
MYSGYITAVNGIKVGHAQDFEALTGVTVILPPEGTVCGVDVRGGAPGTRETDLLRPENFVSNVNAILLAGGSAFGLDAAGGVMKYLEDNGIGLDTGVAKIPIVPASVIFDLICGSSNVRPDFEMGYRACEEATINEKRQGLVGAGTGATVGKILGKDYAMKSGLGSATIRVGELVVSALTVCNAFGDIFDHERKIKIAGCYDYKNKEFKSTIEILKNMGSDFSAFNQGKNTTISVVATNGTFNKSECKKISSMAHNGYGNSIFPVHTMSDGDTIFTLATGEIPADVSLVGALASQVIGRAVANSIYYSQSKGGFISNSDLNRE